jgi:hypothetical protein
VVDGDGAAVELKSEVSALRWMGPRLLKTIPPVALTTRDGYFVPDVMPFCPV